MIYLIVMACAVGSAAIAMKEKNWSTLLWAVNCFIWIAIAAGSKCQGKSDEL